MSFTRLEIISDRHDAPASVLKMSREQEVYILEHCAKDTAKEIADALGLRYSHVYSYMRRRGITIVLGRKWNMHLPREERPEGEYFDVDDYFNRCVTV
jgi:hypothetical protein